MINDTFYKAPPDKYNATNKNFSFLPEFFESYSPNYPKYFYHPVDNKVVENNLTAFLFQFRNPVIIDPKSFKKIELKDLKYYKFQSPDHSWHISTTHISRYYSVLKNNFIDEAEYLEYSSRLNLHNAKDEENKMIVKLNILDYYNENISRLSELGINDESKFVFGKLFYVSNYAVVTNIVKKENYYLELPRGTQYFNYASFSFDSKYISCVGCYNISYGGGFFAVARISNIDLANNIFQSILDIGFLDSKFKWL
jgi:hypothetical protein